MWRRRCQIIELVDVDIGGVPKDFFDALIRMIIRIRRRPRLCACRTPRHPVSIVPSIGGGAIGCPRLGQIPVVVIDEGGGG